MSRLKQTILIVISAVAIVLCIGCCLYIFQFFRGKNAHRQLAATAMPTGAAVSVPIAAPPVQEEVKTPEAAETEETEVPEQPEAPAEPEIQTVEIDIDFEALSRVNDEIYAWLEIPGTTVSYAIVQSETDDLFYNTHGADKAYFSGGAIYSQRYNTKTFDDPMTLLYGHNFHDQSLLAPLLNFMDADFFSSNRNIYIYTPDTVYVYDIFAAYPHTSEHLLLCYDFSTEEGFQTFFDKLSGDKINANFDRALFPAFGDPVLTLSTCYRLSFGQRYLVQAVLTATYPVAKETT